MRCDLGECHHGNRMDEITFPVNRCEDSGWLVASWDAPDGQGGSTRLRIAATSRKTSASLTRTTGGSMLFMIALGEPPWAELGAGWRG